MTHAPPAAAAPWSERLFQATALSPFVLGAGIALAVGALILAVELAFGELRPFLRGEETLVGAEEYRFSTVFALLIGYLAAAYATAVQGSRRTWDALRPVLPMENAELAAVSAEAGRFSRSGLRISGLLGAAVALTIPIFVDGSLDAYRFDLGEIHLTAAIHRMMLPFVGWLFGRTIHAVAADSTRLARAGREHLTVDLLDLSTLTPFTRHGLRNALLAMGTFAILALLLGDWGSRPGLPLVLSFAFLVALGLGLIGLILPVRGAHAAIVQAKARELTECNDAIRARRAAPQAPGAGLSELLAWRTFVENVREWPFDSSTFLRFLLYLAIPLGSWLGGAMVERAVDAALG